MGSFYVEKGETLIITATRDAQLRQAFFLTREREGRPAEDLGAYEIVSPFQKRIEPLREQCKYTVIGRWFSEGASNWMDSGERSSNDGNLVVLNYDDGRGDGDYNDLIVNCDHRVRNQNEDMLRLAWNVETSSKMLATLTEEMGKLREQLAAVQESLTSQTTEHK